MEAGASALGLSPSWAGRPMWASAAGARSAKEWQSRPALDGWATWPKTEKRREEKGISFSFYFQSFTNPVSKAFEILFLIWSKPVVT